MVGGAARRCCLCGVCEGSRMAGHAVCLVSHEGALACLECVERRKRRAEGERE